MAAVTSEFVPVGTRTPEPLGSELAKSKSTVFLMDSLAVAETPQKSKEPQSVGGLADSSDDLHPRLSVTDVIRIFEQKSAPSTPCLPRTTQVSGVAAADDDRGFESAAGAGPRPSGNRATRARVSDTTSERATSVSDESKEENDAELRIIVPKTAATGESAALDETPDASPSPPPGDRIFWIRSSHPADKMRSGAAAELAVVADATESPANSSPAAPDLREPSALAGGQRDGNGPTSENNALAATDENSPTREAVARPASAGKQRPEILPDEQNRAGPAETAENRLRPLETLPDVVPSSLEEWDPQALMDLATALGRGEGPKTVVEGEGRLAPGFAENGACSAGSEAQSEGSSRASHANPRESQSELQNAPPATGFASGRSGTDTANIPLPRVEKLPMSLSLGVLSTPRDSNPGRSPSLQDLKYGTAAKLIEDGNKDEVQKVNIDTDHFNHDNGWGLQPTRMSSAKMQTEITFTPRSLRPVVPRAFGRKLGFMASMAMKKISAALREEHLGGKRDVCEDELNLLPPRACGPPSATFTDENRAADQPFTAIEAPSRPQGAGHTRYLSDLNDQEYARVRKSAQSELVQVMKENRAMTTHKLLSHFRENKGPFGKMRFWERSERK
ncbi:MAG: hypothetical protein BJ554DRAFT_2058, partial [Olpidium bornovanus]